MQKVNMRIQFTDDKTETEVTAVIGIDLCDENDDDIFYYFESEEEIKHFMVEGSANDFIVLEYTIEA